MPIGLVKSHSLVINSPQFSSFSMIHNSPSVGFSGMAVLDLVALPYGEAHTFGLIKRKQQRIGVGFSRGVLVLSAISVNQELEQDQTSNKLQTKYRPAVILPGLGNNTSDYDSLVAALESRGITSTVAQVSRADWLRNAAGLLDGNYWKGTLTPRPVLDWYLERIRGAIEAAKDLTSCDKVSIIGHSAGGWLARVYMADFGTSDISLLLTLGTPHLPPPKGKPGVIDQTRGLLDYLEKTCPGAFHKPDVSYVCVAGRYLKGDKFFPDGDLSVAQRSVDGLTSSDQEPMIAAFGSERIDAEVKLKKAPAPFRERIIGQAYKQVCGLADVWGDGVVPEVSAHLDGAINMTLDGVYHSPVGASDVKRPWYGSPSILEQWVHYLLD